MKNCPYGYRMYNGYCVLESEMKAEKYRKSHRYKRPWTDPSVPRTHSSNNTTAPECLHQSECQMKYPGFNYCCLDGYCSDCNTRTCGCQYGGGQGYGCGHCNHGCANSGNICGAGAGYCAGDTCNDYNPGPPGPPPKVEPEPGPRDITVVDKPVYAAGGPARRRGANGGINTRSCGCHNNSFCTGCGYNSGQPCSDNYDCTWSEWGAGSNPPGYGSDDFSPGAGKLKDEMSDPAPIEREIPAVTKSRGGRVMRRGGHPRRGSRGK